LLREVVTSGFNHIGGQFRLTLHIGYKQVVLLQKENTN
jgi:hypothetical protein